MPGSCSRRQSDQPEGVASVVYVDPNRVHQVFSNLIGNALKFTPAGGRIRIAARAQDPQVLFEVEDSGRGIDAADLPFIFDRFWQGKKALGRGAGLGLPIARGIVDAHGGAIDAESRRGAGSVFRFTLPRADDGADAAAEPGAEAG